MVTTNDHVQEVPGSSPDIGPPPKFLFSGLSEGCQYDTRTVRILRPPSYGTPALLGGRGETEAAS